MQPQIDTLDQLYESVDNLFCEIERDCQDCQDPDCMGYIWLLEQEAQRLYEMGVSLVEINGGPTFIHSFPENSSGELNLSIRYPKCSQLCVDSRRCSIHKDRPFVCHFYPLGLETNVDGTIVWVLHEDCLFVRRLKERGFLLEFEQRARNIINNLSPQLNREILDTYRKVDAISLFPDGENNYIVIGGA